VRKDGLDIRRLAAAPTSLCFANGQTACGTRHLSQFKVVIEKNAAKALSGEPSAFAEQCPRHHL
jgi:hypothetical protein